MGEIMCQGLDRHGKSRFGLEVADISGLLAVAVRAFIEERIKPATLWSVAKLHSSDFRDWVKLGSNEAKVIDRALPWHLMWQPIYQWQGQGAARSDEWTNCLGVSDTRRFLGFVGKAYRENWPASPLPDSEQEQKKSFCDFPDCVVLARSIKRKIHRLERPCVYRMWE